MSKIARNDPCPCGSGRKFKRCCGEAGKQSQTISLSGALSAALEHHNAGRLGEAEALYRQILEVKPDHADALHYLGVIAYQVGNHEVAADLIGKATRISPTGEMFSNLGLVLQAQGQLDDAVDHYRRALSYQPGHVEAHNNLGNALKDKGELDGAVEHYRHALRLRPDFAVAHNNLGVTLKMQGKLDEAVKSFRKALELKADFAEAYGNLLFLYSFSTTLAADEYIALARGWEKVGVPEEARRLAREKAFQREPLGGRRLKLGYMSGDFRQHVVSSFIEQLFVHHDRKRVAV